MAAPKKKKVEETKPEVDPEVIAEKKPETKSYLELKAIVTEKKLGFLLRLPQANGNDWICLLDDRGKSITFYSLLELQNHIEGLE